MTRAVRFLIGGRVQGVGYRYHTLVKARELGLKGWVKNLPDERVECEAQGTDDALKALEAWFWEGPPASRVHSVQAFPLDKTTQLDDFTISS